MTVAVVVMIMIAVLAGLLLARPYWRREADTGMRRLRANVVAYQDRVAEIQNEFDSGLLDAESAAALRKEADQQVLEAGDSTEAAAPAPSGRRLWVAPALALLLVAIASLGYWWSGSWRTQGLITLAQDDPVEAQRQMVDGMVAQLESRLQRVPDDAEGWAMLGRSYQTLGRGPEALQAYQRANGLTTGRPQADWLVAEGELKAMTTESRDLQGSRALFAQALALEPGHPRALWYAGLSAAQGGDYGAALDFWLRLRDQELPPEIVQLLDQRLPQLAQLAGRELPPPKAAPATDAVRLQLEVALAPALRSKVAPGMVLFVFARAENGPPMPLAVRRIESPALPQTVTLDDSLAMMPELKLSQFEQWTVIARLSRSGTVQAESGDLEGRLSVSRAEAGRPLPLVLDRVVP